jgi:hypothetical protein
MVMGKFWICAVGFLLAISWQLPAWAFQPHRAVYDLSLLRAAENSSLADVRGRLANEWTKECDGYLFNQRMVLQLIYDGQGSSLMDYQISSWESLNGREFRFNIRTEINGELIDEYVGKADLDATGGPHAKFTKPKPIVLKLPDDTMFPTTHSLAIINAAGKNARSLQATTFDGSNHETAFRASLILGGRMKEPGKGMAAFDLLKGQAAWPVRLAFFNPTEAGPLPEVEMGFKLFANGIIAGLRLDYRDFSVRGKLQELIKVELPTC